RVAAIHRKAALEREVSGDDVTQALQRVAPAEPLHALQAKPQLAQAVEQCLPDEILLGQLVLFEPANQLINHRQQFGLLILIKLRIGPNGPYQSRKSCKRRHLRRRKIMLERMEIGRASCRERVSMRVVAARSLNEKVGKRKDRA